MTAESTTAISTSLRLTGNFDPDEISRKLSLTPTSQWRAGDTGPAPSMHRPSDGWNLKFSGDEQTFATELERNVQTLIARSNQIREILAEPTATGYLMIAVDMDGDEWPELAISAETMSKLAHLGLSIDIDII